MRIISVLLLTAVTWMGNLKADLVDFYVTNNLGTVGSPGTFISIVDVATNKVEGYVDCTGFDLTHPIDIHLSSDGTKAYITCDTVNSVFVADISTNKVVGKIDDTLNPFNAPVVLEVNLNVTPNIGYVTNEGSNSVSVIDLSVDLVTGKIDDTLGPFNLPVGVGISDDGTKMYVANLNGHNVSVVDPAAKAVTGYVNDALHPFANPLLVAWSASTKAYISDGNGFVGTGFVNVVTGNAVTGHVTTIGFPSFAFPLNILEGPDGKMYITDVGNNNVYIVDPTTDAVTGIFVGTFSYPLGIAITTDNKTAYVANNIGNNVSVVDVATKTQTSTVNPSSFPFFGPYQTQILPTAVPPTPPSSLSRPLRPICIKGVQKNGRFATQSELYNTISWCASPSLLISNYNLYRNGVLIETIAANGSLSYEEHDVSGTIVYSVTAVSAGVESPAVTISLP